MVCFPVQLLHQTRTVLNMIQLNVSIAGVLVKQRSGTLYILGSRYQYGTDNETPGPLGDSLSVKYLSVHHK